MNNNSVHLHEILAIVKKIDLSQNAFAEQITGLSGQMVVLTNRVDLLEERMDRLDERMDRLEKKVHKMDNDNKYREKRASDIIEVNKDTEIGNILRRTLAGVYELKNFKKFFHPITNKEITEFDGFFIVDCSRRNLAKISGNNNCIINESNGKTIIVEAKTTLTIQKINEKIKKIKEMYDILVSYKIKDINTTTKIFQKMYKENKLDLLPLKIYLIFAPEIISQPIIFDYINDINNGNMNKNNYNRYMFKLLKNMDIHLFREDNIRRKEDKVVHPNFKKYIEIIIKQSDNLVDNGTEYILSNLPDMLSMLNKKAKDKFSNLINEIKSILTPYDEMKDAFEFFSKIYVNSGNNYNTIPIPNIKNTKGRIGLYYEDNLDIPELYESEPLTRGGFRKTRRMLKS
jgi:hypothetical protein